MDGDMQIYLGVQTKSPQHTTPLLKAGGDACWRIIGTLATTVNRDCRVR